MRQLWTEPLRCRAGVVKQHQEDHKGRLAYRLGTRLAPVLEPCDPADERVYKPAGRFVLEPFGKRKAHEVTDGDTEFLSSSWQIQAVGAHDRPDCDQFGNRCGGE